MSTELVEMSDGARIRTWTSGPSVADRTAVVLVHGGPGIRDYLGPVAQMIDGGCLVHRYDQRGTGGSTWSGTHTIERHVRDLIELLDRWGHDRATLVGHSYGTELVSRVLLAHPHRVARLVLLAGPFVEPWREEYRAAARARSTEDQLARLEALGAIDARTDSQEVEFLTLKWASDHADRTRGPAWAAEAARERRPVDYRMNAELGAAGRVHPLLDHVDELRATMPTGSVIIGGELDPRPAAALRRYGGLVGCRVVLIPGAGHEPWLEEPDRFVAALRAAVWSPDGRSAEW